MSRDGFWSRRDLLRGGALLGGGLVMAGGTAAIAGPLLRANRPALTHGVASGDVNGTTAVIWTRADRGSQLWVELSTRPDFKDSWTLRGPDLVAEHDFTGRVRVDGLEPGRRLHYRVWADDGDESEPLTGSLRAAPGAGDDVRFVWSADIAGQGWGINPDLGGYRAFDDLAAADPDFFLCSGDFYYGDVPLSETVTLSDGRVWKNLVTPEKAKVAESLDEFRGQYKYNLQDENLRSFLATTPIVSAWDDHEVRDSWYPGELLDDGRYSEKDVNVLAGRARQAFGEYTPNSVLEDGSGRIYRKIAHGPLLDVFVLDMRSYRDTNSANDSPNGGVLLGSEQLAWLKKGLAESTAVWKVIANDLPLATIVVDGAVDGIGQRDSGLPLGREIEIADLLSHIHHSGITGTVWLTADVHYTAAHYYDPGRAAFTDFAPFWEFVTGPLHAGAAGQQKLDTTFGAEVVFAKAPETGRPGPMDGFQFYGEVSISAESKALKVRLMEVGAGEVYRKQLWPNES